MSSLCDTCAKRMKEITYVGLSTVAWTGKYVCTPYNNAPTLPDVVKECKGYVPRKKGQMSLEAFV